jgi:hypothetical protein
MKLKLYCERAWVPADCAHLEILDPFWGGDRYDPEGNARQIGKAYAERAGEIFEPVSTMEESDAVLLPVNWWDLLTRPAGMTVAREVIERAAAAGRRVILFFCHDTPLQFDWPAHAVVFRISAHRSRLRPNEFIVPQWSRDYLADLDGELPVRRKDETPVVGFCGFAPPLGMRPGKRRLKETARLMAHRLGLGTVFPERMAHAARARALLALSRSPLVKTNYLIRSESAFDNPIGAFLPGGTVEAALLKRREFVQNILGSDYVLCARGWANCSIRFSETLSLGRIPVLVDTDCVLPHESAIDWDRYRVLVNENAPAQAAHRIREFHEALAPGEFEARQRACRVLWEEWFSPLGFYKNLYRHLEPGVITA